MSKEPKITTSELVLSAIFFLQQKQGVTSRDITKFICEKRGCKQSQVREEVKKALERATKKGIFEKKRGLYRIKSTFGKNIIAENVRKLEQNDKTESPNLEEADMSAPHGDPFQTNFFRADFFSGQTPWTKNAEFESTKPFQNSIYLRENEDDFEIQSGENISVERLRGPRSDDDDEDFLEEDEYDDDEIDFFADDQFPTAEDALRTPRDSSVETTNAKSQKYNEPEDAKPKKKSKRSKSSRKHSKRHRATRCDDEKDRNEYAEEEDDEDEYEDNHNETTTGQHLKKDAKENENKKLKEQQCEREESLESESTETLAKSLKISQEWNDGEELYKKNTFKSQNLSLSSNDKYQKHYNSKETNRRNDSNQRNKSSSTKLNIKVEPGSSDYENMGSSLRSENQEIFSDPENRGRKSKRERSSSLFRPSNNSTFKRKVAGDSKLIKHRKFN